LAVQNLTCLQHVSGFKDSSLSVSPEIVAAREDFF
jgi:hypothetical protein